MTLQIIFISLLIILLSSVIVRWFRSGRHNNFIVSPWLDHSLRLGQDYYRVRHILRLGEIYNSLGFWNDFNPFTGDESQTMWRIRMIIEKYSQELQK